MSLGPFDLTGGPFLALYCGLLVAATVAAFAIPRWLRPEGRVQRVTDADQLAWLAGGRPRYCDTVVARLLTAGHLTFSGRRKLAAQGRGRGSSPAEIRLLALPGSFGWTEIQREITDYAEPVERELVRKALLMDRGTTLHLRFWQASPLVVLLLFGAVKWEVGTARDKPVGFLTALMLLTLVLAVVRWAKIDRRTRAGIAALEVARHRTARLHRAPTADETPLAVALYGTTVLTGSAWSAYHDLRRDSGGGGDGGASSSGDGSSGGGGCGGCGGGD